jgi:hypothetical protein
MATRFDSRNVASQCAKEDRFKGGNQEFRLVAGNGTQYQPFLLSNVTQELDQLTSPTGEFAADEKPWQSLPTILLRHHPTRAFIDLPASDV